MTNISLFEVGTGREIFGVVPVPLADTGTCADVLNVAFTQVMSLTDAGTGIDSGWPNYNDPNYITNLCTNPSFETDLTGWTPVGVATTLAQTNATALYGTQSMQVTTPGSVPGEGVYGPQGNYPFAQGYASASCSVSGSTGTLLINFVNAAGGVVLASQAVVLSGSGWQTVTFTGIAFTPGAQYYILITTLGVPQAITFYVDGVMYTPDGQYLTPYVDGDQANCQWSGTPEESTSFQQFQFGISGSVGLGIGGWVNVIVPGQVFPLPPAVPLTFFCDPQDGATTTVLSIAAALTDFGIWQLTDPDPAQTYGWWTNSGNLSSQTGYNRIYGMVVPPIDYPVSGGNYAWRRAAYAAVGFSWAAVPTATEQILTDVQLEYARTAVGSASTPTAYQRPRQLQTIIKPSRLNYITNPAFAISTAGWSGLGAGTTLAVSSAQFPGNISTFDNVAFTVLKSCLVTCNGAGDSGIQISVPFLIPGQTYMASCYVMAATTGIADIIGTCGAGNADVAGLVDPEFCYGGDGTTGYGSGPYGGVWGSNNPLPPNRWTRLSFAFVASGTDTETFQATMTFLSAPAYPQSFYVTAVLVEPGDILQPYFDGYSGAAACWEYAGGTATPVAQGGTSPGVSRSYYYEQLQFGQVIVNQTLAANVPMGISYAAPLYAIPPTQ